VSPKGKRTAASKTPIEYSLLLTATMCLLAFGVVMVFSASSTTSLLGDSGDSAYYLKRTALFGIAGLLIMRILAVRGVAVVRALTPALLAVGFGLCVLVLMPGFGVEVNGAKRWIGAGMFQIQPSELLKVALILYGAHLLATRPKMLSAGIGPMVPFLATLGAACLLVVVEPDLGSAMVVCFAAAALLLTAGARPRDICLLAVGLAVVVALAVMIEPYRMQRLTGFIDPGADPTGSGFQVIQAKIAIGSGGIFGTGLGEGIQKAFYLPEAHTDMIAAVIGEELGFVGIAALVGLYGLFGYAGLQIARRARDRYGKLLATGLTSLVCVQAVINLCAVLGLAPLTGVPLPFVSYGNSSMLVLLAAVGLLLNIARGGSARSAARPSSGAARRSEAAPRRAAVAAPGGRLRVVDGSANGRNRGGRNGGARRSGGRRRRRASR
jgi:cell division protein FtsW